MRLKLPRPFSWSGSSFRTWLERLRILAKWMATQHIIDVHPGLHISLYTFAWTVLHRWLVLLCSRLPQVLCIDVSVYIFHASAFALKICAYHSDCVNTGFCVCTFICICACACACACACVCVCVCLCIFYVCECVMYACHMTVYIVTCNLCMYASMYGWADGLMY